MATLYSKIQFDKYISQHQLNNEWLIKWIVVHVN